MFLQKNPISCNVDIYSNYLIFNFELYQIILSKLNFPTQFYGYLYASFMVLGGIGAILSKKLLSNYGEKKLFIISMIGVAISYFIFALTNKIVLIMIGIVLQQIIFGSVGLAVRNILMNNLFSQDTKSTLMSVYSLLNSFLKGLLVIALGQILSISGNGYAYIIMTCIMIFCIIYSIFGIKDEKVSH